MITTHHTLNIPTRTPEEWDAWHKAGDDLRWNLHLDLLVPRATTRGGMFARECLLKQAGDILSDACDALAARP